MKPVKKSRTQPLVLRRETVVVLTAQKLDQVRGAGETGSSAGRCAVMLAD